ncbi:MAG TPA: EAL domain-containing protein [Mycobacteriales bacterium]|nr:EAL domain-containing protein [Mycobacteriales bacterium]
MAALSTHLDLGYLSQQELLAAVVDGSSVAHYMVDRSGVVHMWNPAAERVFGWTAAEAIGRQLPFVSEQSRPEYDRLRGQVFDGCGFTDVETRRQVKDGASIWLSLTTVPLRDRAGNVRAVLANAQDITARKRAESALLHQSRQDALTGLPNRDRFSTLLGAAVADPVWSGAVLALDLDDFKTVNDTFGHQVGDQLLSAVAARLQATLGANDEVARIGGDEFAILLHARSAGAQQRAAGAILECLQRPFAVAGHQLDAKASGGLAAGGRHDAWELLRRADLAMYAAKRDGGGTYRRFDEEMHAAIVDRLQRTRELREAIGAEQLRLHYQPIVELATGRVTGLEALVRWQHPTYGLLGPDQFIPLAEATGSIADVDRWVLATACSEFSEAARSRPGMNEICLSVNVSASRLQDPALLTDVMVALGANRLPASRLQIEVTETAVITDLQQAAEVLTELRTHGVLLALDDFGTGFSSLTLLRDLPVDVLKIDGSFVSGHSPGTANASIIAATLQLADALGLCAVAEGIETHEQAQALIQQGCLRGQGYLYGRPMPLPEVRC